MYFMSLFVLQILLSPFVYSILRWQYCGPQAVGSEIRRGPLGGWHRRGTAVERRHWQWRTASNDMRWSRLWRSDLWSAQQQICFLLKHISFLLVSRISEAHHKKAMALSLAQRAPTDPWVQDILTLPTRVSPERTSVGSLVLISNPL